MYPLETMNVCNNFMAIHSSVDEILLCRPGLLMDFLNHWPTVTILKDIRVKQIWKLRNTPEFTMCNTVYIWCCRMRVSQQQPFAKPWLTQQIETEFKEVGKSVLSLCDWFSYTTMAAPPHHSTPQHNKQSASMSVSSACTVPKMLLILMKLSWLILVSEWSLAAAAAAEIAWLTNGCQAKQTKPTLNFGSIFTCSPACPDGILFVLAMSSRL